jgi:hypothetical protein
LLDISQMTPAHKIADLIPTIYRTPSKFGVGPKRVVELKMKQHRQDNAALRAVEQWREDNTDRKRTNDELREPPSALGRVAKEKSRTRDKYRLKLLAPPDQKTTQSAATAGA